MGLNLTSPSRLSTVGAWGVTFPLDRTRLIYVWIRELFRISKSSNFFPKLDYTAFIA